MPKNSNSGSDLATYIASNGTIDRANYTMLMRWSLQKLFIGGFIDEKVSLPECLLISYCKKR
ncbi:MAG: hypothetical protein ACLS67_22200 [Anaerobutyricum soehngenii]